jgi:hypothetical protein
MLISLFSAKASPGVTSSALALASVWPRPCVLVEADPSGGDLTYRCKAATGGPLAPTPNLLGLASATRVDAATPLRGWTQKLGCGVDVVTGVAAPAQARALVDLWAGVATAMTASEVDVIADLGRLRREAPTVPLATHADLWVPVLAASLDSLMHTRELVRDLAADQIGTIMPLLISRARTAAPDCQDIDEVMAGTGLFIAPAAHLPLDHPGLAALQDGANPSGRGRGFLMVRAARTVADRLLATTGTQVR